MVYLTDLQKVIHGKILTNHPISRPPTPFYHVEQGKEGEFDLPEGKITPQRLGDKEK